MKTIITISALMFAFGIANANNINLPADQPQATVTSEKSSSSSMLDSLQSVSERASLKGFDSLDERVQQKLTEMQVADCTPKK